MKAPHTAALACALASTLIVGGATAAFAHGYVGNSGSDVVARVAMQDNGDIGAIRWEPQSLEGPKGFSLDPRTGGPADGKIASAGVASAARLDDQSPARWKENQVSVGQTVRVGWQYTAPHRSSEWRYYITKNGWDQNAPLARSSLQELTTIKHDGSAAPQGVQHEVTLPADHQGDHVIVAVWDVADTANAFYNVIDVSIGGSATPAPTDTTAPTAPAQVLAPAVTSSSARLTWSASRDDVGVARYEISRATEGGAAVALGTTSATEFVDESVTADTRYRYSIIAIDAAGNRSAAGTLAVHTPARSTGPDTAAPTSPSGVHSMGTTAQSVELMWTASRDETGVDHYVIERGGASGAYTSVGTATDVMFVDSALTPATDYRYRILAVDAAGNVSEASAPFTVRTQNAATPSSPDEWDPKGAYTRGDRVTYQGASYTATVTHRGNGDPNWITAPSLWTPAHTH